MRYASVCSGIEAPSVAWHALGWTAVFFSEIEKFPSAVLHHHWPEVPNLGDMTRIIASDWIGKVDLLVGGTPCQSFSVAGLRRGVADARGNLTLKFVELVHGIEPKYVVWENVPGILSDKENAFGCFLAGLVGGTEPIVPRTCDGRWTSAGLVCGPRRAAAWRVLDAQYVAVAGDSCVPQRRARVFVISRNFGDVGRLETASPGRNAERICGLLAQILFEPEGMPRNTSPRGEAGEGVAALTANGVGTSGADDNQAQAGHIVCGSVSHALRAEGFDASEDGTGRGVPLVPTSFNWQSGGDCWIGPTENLASATQAHQTQAIAFAQNSRDEVRLIGGGGQTTGALGAEVGTKQQTYVAFTIHGTDKTANVASETDVAGCLRSKPPGSIENSSTTVIAFSSKNDGADADEVSPTVRAMNHNESHANAGGQVAVAYQCHGSNVGEIGTLRAGTDAGSGVPFVIQESQSGVRSYETAGTVRAEAPGSQAGGSLVSDTLQRVRRLTPVECARLQAFPDAHCQIQIKGKPAADGPQYRAYGNAMCTKVMKWIGQRIDTHERGIH